VKLLRPRQTAAALSISLATLWRIRQRDATFPRAIQIGAQAVGFDEDELRAWVETRRLPEKNAPTAAASPAV